MKQDFDKKIDLPFAGEIIHYGIIHGSDKIVFIKAGANGNMYGYQNKYLKIASNINKSHGYTVICSSNPEHDLENPISQAIELIYNYAESHHFADYEVLYMGHSDGAAMAAYWGHLYPNIKRMLLINPPLFYNWPRIKKGMQEFHGERATFVYGSLDPSYKYAEMVKLIKNEQVRLEIIPRADHHFTNKLDEFMDLPYKYLLS